MRWINVDENYLDYLRNYESRIPRTDYVENKYKPFFGVLFETDDLYYVTQVSHPQKRHEKLKQQLDFYKLYNGNQFIAVVNLNYMFPIPKQHTSPFQKKYIDTYRTFESEEEKKNYIALLDLELKAINRLNLGEKAKFLYDLKYKNQTTILPEDVLILKKWRDLQIYILIGKNNF